MKILRQILLFICAIPLLFGCTEKGSQAYLPSVSGKAGEVLVVINTQLYKSKISTAFYDLLGQDIDGMNWDEPLFDISFVTQDGFTDMLKPSRNLLWIDVSKTYSKNKVIYKKGVWGRGQAFIKIQAPDTVGLRAILNESGSNITSFFVEAERERLISYFKENTRDDWTKRVKDSSGIDIPIPRMFVKQKFADNFIWFSSGSLNDQADLLIYWYDYTDSNTFTKEYLLAKRDSILKKYVPGPTEGSFMATERRFEPAMQELNLDSNYVAELRGIWKVEGNLMGGPFISQTRLFAAENKIVTVEGFVFSPNQKKRNLMRRLEAVMYSLKMPK